MSWKDIITLGIALAALVLSVLNTVRARRTDRLAVRQSLIDKTYAALAKDAEQHCQIFQLILRTMALEDQSDDVTALRETLSDILGSAEKRARERVDLYVDSVDDKADLLLRQNLGLLSHRAALLAKAETKLAALELLSRVQKQSK